MQSKIPPAAFIDDARRTVAEAAPDLQRRAWCQATLYAGLLGAVAPAVALPARRETQEIAIVGGGLAGLIAAYRLQQAGVLATVYEGSSRLGGRVFTDRETFGPLQISERGGEAIDSIHFTVRRLVEEFGLSLEARFANDDGFAYLYEFDGQRYTYAELLRSFVPLIVAASRDERLFGPDTRYDLNTPASRALDRLSVTDYLNLRLEGGADSLAGRYARSLATGTFGIEADRLSAINTIYTFSLLGLGTRHAHPNRELLQRALARRGPASASDEEFGPGVYQIAGGNDQLASILAERLGDQVVTEHRLVRAATEGEATRLHFETPAGAREVLADRVVMTLPFRVLRTLDIADLALGARKRVAINTLGMGTNSKLAVQTNGKVWRELGASGGAETDRDFQILWEQSAVQPGESGVLLSFTGGDRGVAVGTGSTAEQASNFVNDVDSLFPGVAADWNGRALRSHWPSEPFQLGSYAGYEVGQFTTLRGIESAREGAVHFAGEHTALAFQGFIEGALRSGERTANEVLAAMAVRSATVG
ncbi:MAG: NAD(P)/FAD-dependent oxidoreductase [Pseudomonadota bacterium]